MNEIIINDENGFCINNIVIDKIRCQNIFDVNRIDFFEKFNILVNDHNLIMLMKRNTKNIILKNEKRFNDYFYKTII